MQPVTGVQRVAREVVRAMDQLVADRQLPWAAHARLRIVCEAGADVSDLGLRATEVERTSGKATGHLWEQAVLPRHVRGGHLLCLGNTAPLVMLAAGQPVTVMIHDLSYQQFPGAYRLRYRLGHRMMLPFLLRRARKLLTVSETEKAVLTGLHPPALESIRVVRNGGWRDGAVSRRDRERPVDGHQPYVLYVGSLSARKNIHGVLATATLLAREDGIATVLVGSASDILAPIAASVPDDIRHLVRFAGQVNDLDTLAGIYRDAACLLFPSFYEASPLPPLEAMSFGCPAVVSAIPSMTERCGRAATYVDPASVDDMVAAVRSVIGSPSCIAEQVERGYQRALRWTWRSQAQAVLSALLEGAKEDLTPQARPEGGEDAWFGRERAATLSL
ncbi:glycosyltransferase family 4 protein [Novosphingobium cyanobacteriorum]|uniref:Glycosyltransferase family 1 protein n=1 Tax=Novosphingobium cyanobacteriorum TaxID=3024215 RepID=A0ABT6CMW9_9SPHN|nr:glycosyltransferase family 1 protein [Novosphingobium cyanobacteriorum]MDF8335259.1 glycosyltransferase family 1 protein [Novosphingobium cyanobacteriorum]